MTGPDETPTPEPDPTNPLAVVADVVTELERIGVVLGLDENDKLVLDGATHRIDDELLDRMKLVRELLKSHVNAGRSLYGEDIHRWVKCSECGVAKLIGPGKKTDARRCVMTPKCPGRYPRVDRLARPRRSKRAKR